MFFWDLISFSGGGGGGWGVGGWLLVVKSREIEFIISSGMINYSLTKRFPLAVNKRVPAQKLQLVNSLSMLTSWLVYGRLRIFSLKIWCFG